MTIYPFGAISNVIKKAGVLADSWFFVPFRSFSPKPCQGKSPTDPFTTLELLNPSQEFPELYKIRRTNSLGSEIVKRSVGGPGIFGLDIQVCSRQPDITLYDAERGAKRERESETDRAKIAFTGNNNNQYNLFEIWSHIVWAKFRLCPEAKTCPYPTRFLNLHLAFFLAVPIFYTQFLLYASNTCRLEIKSGSCSWCAVIFLSSFFLDRFSIV